MNDEYNDLPIKDIYIPRHQINYNNENKDSPHSKRKKRKLRKWVYIVLLLFFIITFIYSLVRLILWKKDNDNTQKIIDNINENTNLTTQEDDEDVELIGDSQDKENDYWYYITFPLISADFSKLKEKNTDTEGWINVNNTNINYPYVQTSDNSFYLNHSFDKKYNEAGWVYMDYRNNSDLSNKNTILYAHSRLDKTMFGSLSKVLKKDWYSNKDNHIIRISTEGENTLWQIFSVYKIKEESYYITTDFYSDKDYIKFLDTIKERSIYDFNTTLTSEDRVLTLSTCYSETERTVVHAKLIKRSKRS